MLEKTSKISLQFYILLKHDLWTGIEREEPQSEVLRKVNVILTKHFMITAI
jgi:hypothetical protein